MDIRLVMFASTRICCFIVVGDPGLPGAALELARPIHRNRLHQPRQPHPLRLLAFQDDL